ncbi:DUF4199 domain-containing protein [Ulvibacter antarcticus]|uniref:Uncharacterized protein DUF4199 n=1 Tax=Ulvibacter antarcticus TaxID=442714 RepID=A0A3L9YWF5_9FLAO|nr:DUF4199 domain-containing protein [Ulvibacter antarcticus]RMA64654.1 uncharacterized protein DUF4199 [Ulvibacter antarcticus]
MEAQTISTKKNAVSYGVLLGIVLTLITTVLYVINTALLTKWWIGIFTLLLAISFGIVSVAKAKSLQNGLISFKEAFTSYFITIAIGLLISVVVNILIFVVIDPDAAAFLQEEIMNMTKGMMEKFGAPEAEIDKALEKMAEDDAFSAFAQLKSYVFQLAFYSIFGLLIALIFKKNDPNAIA